MINTQKVYGRRCRHKFRTCARQQRGILSKETSELSAYVLKPYTSRPQSGVSAVSTAIRGMENYRRIPRLQLGQVAAFQDLWAMRAPLIVHVGHRFNGLWTPDVLTKVYGDESITMIEVNAGKRIVESEVRLADFFKRYKEARPSDAWAVKVKVSVVWPSKSTLLNVNHIGLAQWSTHSSNMRGGVFSIPGNATVPGV